MDRASGAAFWTDHWIPSDVALRDRFCALDASAMVGRIDLGGGRRATGKTRPLESLENRTCAFECDDGAWLFLKLYRPERWSREAILAEHAFVGAVAARGAAVVAPLVLPLAHGAPPTSLQEVDGISAAVFPMLEGEVLDDAIDDTTLAAVARLVARLHDAVASAGARDDVRATRPPITPQAFGGGNLDFLLGRALIPASVRDEYARAANEVIARATPLFEAIPLQPVHADVYPGNVLAAPHGSVLLDFDDLAMGPAIADLWTLARTRQKRVVDPRLLDLVVGAYREVRALPDAQVELVPALGAMRRIWGNAWIGSRAFDPVLREKFPTFGTADYWAEDLERMRELARG